MLIFAPGGCAAAETAVTAVVGGNVQVTAGCRDLRLSRNRSCVDMLNQSGRQLSNSGAADAALAALGDCGCSQPAIRLQKSQIQGTTWSAP